MSIQSIIDANINRVTEGCRVIEDYVRFELSDEPLTHSLSNLRKAINKTNTQYESNLQSRDITKDARAKDPPAKRQSSKDMLIANFKRAEEGLRVLEEVTSQTEYSNFRYDLYELEKQVVLKAIKKKIKSGIYLVGSDIGVLEQGLKWGVSLVQLRDKSATKSDILAKAKDLKALSQHYDTPIIINDHIDIACEIDADGLHTGQDDVSVSVQRKILGDHKIIGKTSHNLEQGLAAQKEGADYISVGPIWETPSKPNRSGIGFDYLKQSQDKITIPYVAIGGIDLENCDEVIQYSPPLIGLIRDYNNVPEILKKLSNKKNKP